MDYKTYIGFVDAHAESNRCNDNIYIFIEELVLPFGSQLTIETGMISHRLDTIGHEHFRQVFGGFAVEGINDAAFIFMLLNKTYNALIRLFKVDLGLNFVIEIRPVERRNKNFRLP